MNPEAAKITENWRWRRVFIGKCLPLLKRIMLVRLSPDYAAAKAKIDEAVGKTFTLEERRKLEKTSSADHEITGASIEIYNLLVLNEHRPTCTLERRPNGLVISF